MTSEFSSIHGEDPEKCHILSYPEESMENDSYHSTRNGYTTKSSEDAVCESIESEDHDAEGGGEISFRNLPRKSKILLLLCAIANFASCLSYAVPSPFYPQEAEEKGLSSEMIGFFFSIYEVVVFLTSPLFGLHLSKIGPRFLLLSGIFVAGAGSIIFGVLGDSPPGDDFLVLSLVNRALIAVGYSAFVTSMQVTVLSEVPGNEGLAFSLMEGSAGAGFMVGPAVGGVLFEFGGFGLPFYVIGSVVSLCGCILYFILPPIKEVEQKNQPSVFRILLSPLVWISLPCITVCSIGMGFLDPTLAKHLDPFDLSTGVVGLFFLIVSLVYCVFTPVWGWLSDSKKIGQGPLLIVGATTTGLAFLILGPSPWLGFLPFEIWTVTIGLVLLGLSQPGGMIPTIKCLTNAAIDSGLEDNIDTYGMVVGLYNFAYCLGAAGGPLLAGFLVDYYGFGTGVNIVGSTNFAMAAICLVYFITQYKRRKRKSYDVLQVESYSKSNQSHHDKKPKPGSPYSNGSSESESSPTTKDNSIHRGSTLTSTMASAENLSYTSFSNTNAEDSDSYHQKNPLTNSSPPLSNSSSNGHAFQTKDNFTKSESRNSVTLASNPSLNPLQRVTKSADDILNLNLSRSSDYRKQYGAMSAETHYFSTHNAAGLDTTSADVTVKNPSETAIKITT